MFNLEKTSLWLEIDRIFKLDEKDVRHELVGKIHTEVKDFLITQIKSRDVVRDYEAKIGGKSF